MKHSKTMEPGDLFCIMLNYEAALIRIDCPRHATIIGGCGGRPPQGYALHQQISLTDDIRINATRFKEKHRVQ